MNAAKYLLDEFAKHYANFEAGNAEVTFYPENFETPTMPAVESDGYFNELADRLYSACLAMTIVQAEFERHRTARANDMVRIIRRSFWRALLPVARGLVARTTISPDGIHSARAFVEWGEYLSTAKDKRPRE